MAEDQRIRLSSVQKTCRDTRKRGVKQRPLSFDDVPMIRIVVRGDLLDRSRNEIRHHGIDRYPVARDKYAGLPRSTEIRAAAPDTHLPFDRERRVHFPNRAVGPDREQALATALLAVADLEALCRMPHIGELASMMMCNKSVSAAETPSKSTKKQVCPQPSAPAAHSDPGVK